MDHTVTDPLAEAIRGRLAVLRGPTGAGAALVDRLVDSFLVRAPAYLAELEAAVRERDAGTVARLAHSLGGMAGNLGAAGLAGLCERLETAEIDGFDRLLAGLRAAYAQVWTAMREITRFANDSPSAGTRAGP